MLRHRWKIFEGAFKAELESMYRASGAGKAPETSLLDSESTHGDDPTPAEGRMAFEARIAHLSDLHFGCKGQSVAWAALSAYLVGTLKPDLIVITGDIVHSPGKHRYADAYKDIRSLNTPFLVCPGNHDRFSLGNKLPILSRVRTGAAAHFDSTFVGRVVTGGMVQRPDVLAQRGWNVCFLGLDTSRHADNLARGWVDPLDRQELEQALDNLLKAPGPEPDLIIVMVHHHILPIRALEARRHGDGAHLLNATAMINAASFVEALAARNVDIALHGHEHSPNWARYGSLAPVGGETAVLAAGSATGNDSVKGCRIDGASFNVMRLGADRSVSMEVYQHQNGGWEKTQDSLVKTAMGLRRTRLLRAARFVSKPDSEVVKSIRFTPERDIVVAERRTNWLLNEGFWRKNIKNSTGFPVEAVLRVSVAGRVCEVAEIEFQPLGVDNTWQAEWRAPPALASNVVDLEVTYRWQGGAVLTREEMTEVRNGPNAGLFRREGLEYAAIKPLSLVAMARLHLHLPEGFEPDDMRVRVTRDDDLVGDDRQFSAEEEELSPHRRKLGPSEWSLDIPFPRKDLRYALVWKPPAAPSPSAPARRFLEYVRSGGGDKFVLAFQGALRGTPLEGSSVALYTSQGSGWERVLKRAAFAPGAGCPDAPPERIDVLNERRVVGAAYVGSVSVAYRGGVGEAAECFGRDEQWVGAAPARHGFEWPGSTAPAVVRLGIGRLPTTPSDALVGSDQETLYAHVSDGMIAAMAVVRSARSA